MSAPHGAEQDVVMQEDSVSVVYHEESSQDVVSEAVSADCSGETANFSQT